MMANIFHEKQVKELCAIHALNNLFQQEMFIKEDIDGVCETLSPSRWFNPHRSVLGTGNYDINVILYALHSKGYAGVWFDKRKNPSTINMDTIVGVIVNTPSPYTVAGLIPIPLNRRHWFAVRKIDGCYYNLDSKLVTPIAIGPEAAVLQFLKTELDKNDRELFIVMTQEVEKDGSWVIPVDNT